MPIRVIRLFDIFYGATADNGSGEMSGVQASSSGAVCHDLLVSRGDSHQWVESYLYLAVRNTNSDTHPDCDTYIHAKDFAYSEATPDTRASPIVKKPLIRV